MRRHLILFLFSTVTVFGTLHGEVERRTAIDVGSGGTKIAIADVETDTNQIVQVVFENSYPVPYQASLDKSTDGTFDEETKALGLKTFKEITDLSQQYQVKKISAIATSAFRKSNNAKKFVEEIQQQTQIKVQVITQKEEGEIAFFSAVAAASFDSEELIVWDIGTGSLQMTTKNPAGELIVYMGEQMGSVAFKSYIVNVIQDSDVEEKNSPNPMDESDVKLADSYVRAFGRKAYPLIKQKIKAHGKVVGIGRLFNNSISPIASEGEVITRDGLRKYINFALNKTDEEINNPYAHVDVSNCILALAVMKALHIQEIHPVNSTTTKGMLVYPGYWSE